MLVCDATRDSWGRTEKASKTPSPGVHALDNLPLSMGGIDLINWVLFKESTDQRQKSCKESGADGFLQALKK